MTRYFLTLAAVFAAETAQAKECMAWALDDDGQITSIPIFMTWMAWECKDMPGLYAEVWNKTNECMFPKFEDVSKPKIMEYPDPITGRGVYHATKTAQGPIGCLAPGERVTVVLPHRSGYFTGDGYQTPATQPTTTTIGDYEFRFYNVRLTDGNGVKHLVDSQQTTVCDPLYYSADNMSPNGIPLITFQYATGCHKI